MPLSIVKPPKLIEGALPSLNLTPVHVAPPTEEQWARLEGIEAVRRLCDQFGYARVASWVKNLAAIHGEGVEPETREPAHERAGAYGEYARGSER